MFEPQVLAFMALVFLCSWLTAEGVEAWENKNWWLVALDAITAIVLVVIYAVSF